MYKHLNSKEPGPTQEAAYQPSAEIEGDRPAFFPRLQSRDLAAALDRQKEKPFCKGHQLHVLTETF